MSSKFGLPILNLPKLSEDPVPISDSSSDEDIIHDMINNMHIKTDFKKLNEQISSPSELKYDSRLYKYKKELACRNIEFIMNQSDLIKCHNDKSGIIYLQITLIDNDPNIAINEYEIPVKNSTNSNSGKRFRSGSLSGIFSPKNKKTPRSPKISSIKNDSLKISAIKNDSLKISAIKDDSSKSLTVDNQIVEAKIINIAGNDYSINYKLSDYPYSIFKIKNVYNTITCYGICDPDMSGNELLNSGYDSHNIFNYEVIMPKIFDKFQSCMLICTSAPYNIVSFIDILPSIITELKF
jgi:hypothetical protein